MALQVKPKGAIGGRQARQEKQATETETAQNMQKQCKLGFLRPSAALQRFATRRRRRRRLLCGPAIAISFPFAGILFPFLASPPCLQSPFRLFSLFSFIFKK